MSLPTILRMLTLAAIAMAPIQIAAAQQDVPPPRPAGAQAQDWYYGPSTPTAETQPIAVQKAQLRAKQRMARLEALRRYGLSPNRPPAVAVPFTSVQTLSWMRNGKSPFIHYPSDQTRVYYAYPNSYWR